MISMLMNIIWERHTLEGKVGIYLWKVIIIFKHFTKINTSETSVFMKSIGK